MRDNDDWLEDAPNWQDVGQLLFPAPTAAKRERLKTLMDRLSDEGVERLYPVLRWWIDPEREP